MKTYIRKNVPGTFQAEEGFEKNFKSGTSYEDYLTGLWVELNDKQIAFLKENPAASVKEIIEMKLVPLPPEPTLDEMKEVAINQVMYEAAMAIERLYPSSVIRDVVLGRMGEKEIAQLREDYENTITSVNDALSNAKELIDKATDADSARKAVDGFADSLRVATVDSVIVRDVIRDSLIKAERSKNTDLIVEKNN